MKIIILGAGQVGSSVARSLSSEDNDITVVDVASQRLRELQDRLDIRGVEGNASHPRVLTRAGAEDADMVVALTNSDEINMIACQVCYTIFSTPTKIARVRAAEYLDYPELFSGDHCPVDVLISPEQLVTEYVARLIEYPGALQVLDFAGGRAQVVAFRAEGELAGHSLRELPQLLPDGVEIRVAAIFRDERSVVPDGDTILQRGDTVFAFGSQNCIRATLKSLGDLSRPAKRVILAGGGNIGSHLARLLEANYHVKLMERSSERARQIAESLQSAIVLTGDCADEELLREENIDQTDVYCALTNDDEANILSSMLAKRLGARKVITLINRPAYANLVESGTIDVAVSPQQVTIGALLTHVRRGHMVKVHSLRQGAAEVIEAVAHGDQRSSKVVGRALEDIELPADTTIGGIVRGDDVIVAHHDTVIEAEDHIILFVADKRNIRELEQLFQVAVTFI